LLQYEYNLPLYFTLFNTFKINVVILKAIVQKYNESKFINPPLRGKRLILLKNIKIPICKKKKKEIKAS